CLVDECELFGCEATCHFQVAWGNQCDDADPCTQNDQCGSDGTCMAGSTTDCEDFDPCTVDACDPTTGMCVSSEVVCDAGHVCVKGGCVAVAPCATSADCGVTDQCTGWICESGQCIAADPCDDGNVCTKDSCTAGVGCTWEPADLQGTTCGGDLCQVWTCNDGNCEPPMVDYGCDDSNDCTSDWCDSEQGCMNEPINCDTGDTCTVSICDPDAGGCTHTPLCDTSLKCHEGQCYEPGSCIPQCGDWMCGDDGCGGTCGDCAADTECLAGTCGVATTCANTVACVGACGDGDASCMGACLAATTQQESDMAQTLYNCVTGPCPDLTQACMEAAYQDQCQGGYDSCQTGYVEPTPTSQCSVALACAAGCQDSACLDSCGESLNEGAAAYQALSSCLQATCPDLASGCVLGALQNACASQNTACLQTP
ncbi:MAG: hypothetical protein ACI9WU_000548, partial [Myxococcota bacterium]